LQAFLRRSSIVRATRTFIATALLLAAFASARTFAQTTAAAPSTAAVQHNTTAPPRKAAQNSNFRSLSGTVTNQQHEPLRGSVVKLQNQDDQSVITFLIGNDGHYVFKRISINTDYTVWATFRGHRSKTHFVSKFNSKTTPVVDLEIKLD
jgi:phosphate-selective porin